MLENFSLSGFFLCYAPLAVVIIGFIAFAGLTDAHARRTYLRRMDPRPEAEHPDDEPVALDKPVRAETPAGLAVTLTPEQGAAS